MKVSREIIQKVSLFAMILSMMATLNGCKVIENGEVGVSKSFGVINDKGLEPGIYFNIPIVREIAPWSVKTQQIREQIETPSKEGLMVMIEATVHFKPVAVVDLRKTVGDAYIPRVVVPTLKNVFRDVVGKNKVEDIIRSQESVRADATKLLVQDLEHRGIQVEALLITGLSLPDKFKQAVELKLESEQRALQKEFELIQAKKDAEIEIARAEGSAKAQEIVKRTLSPEYLQYLWISTLNQHPNVIYVATESNMPLLRNQPDPSAKQSVGQGSTK